MRNIAIIDDNSTGRLVLRRLLEEKGYNIVAEGENGEQAIEICATHKPDLVVMDVKMPRKDGIEAASEINALSPTPVVLLTARDDVATVRRAADAAGVMAYLIKPIREEELFPALELAASRFKEFMELREENAGLKNTLEARKLVEKAKGLLMEKDGLSEGEAFARIRRISMDKRKSMSEIAGVIIAALEHSKAG